MDLYFPIAEMSLNAPMLFGLGMGVGILSGVFGVGGGFLMTPLLIFIGVPPAVAVGTEANQVVAASVSGALAHWRRGNIDIKMGVVILIGGFIGSTFGVGIFTWLNLAEKSWPYRCGHRAVLRHVSGYCRRADGHGKRAGLVEQPQSHRVAPQA